MATGVRTGFNSVTRSACSNKLASGAARPLGILWCLTLELLQKYTATDNGACKGVWFKAGAMVFEFYGLNYMGAPCWCAPSPSLPCWPARLS